MKEPKDIKILIVEDEPSLRKAMVFDFQRKGFQVRDAENGKEAFEMLKADPADVVLTDVRMPGGDGIELLDRVKALDPALPVVMFITGFADISIEDAYDKGVDAVFAKPFDRKLLVETVLRAVSSKEEQWREVSGEILPTDFSIELSFPDYNQAIKGRVINLGRGGMFVALKDTFPVVEARAQFQIRFQSGPMSAIYGNGVVRWVRIHETGGHPSGCGIEFRYLSDENRKDIINLIEGLKTKAFIPKS